MSVEAWAIKNDKGPIKVSMLGSEWNCWRDWFDMWGGYDDEQDVKERIESHILKGYSCVRVRIEESRIFSKRWKKQNFITTIGKRTHER